MTGDARPRDDAGAGGDADAVGGRGRVVLVGGGPGDPGLITLAGWRALQEADVVVTDHLGPVSVLDDLPEGVEVVDVAKHPRGPSTPQETTNALLVEHALAGRVVVRLKGGDPFLFGRGGEEVDACRAAGVPVAVVPGVTSAVAVPALAGIPVTDRELSQGVTVLSAHVPPGDPRSTVDWAAVARTGTTVVVLMGVRTLRAVATALVDGGLPASTPVACVQDGGLPTQRVVAATLADAADAADAAGLRPPVVTVVGAVAARARVGDGAGGSDGPAAPTLAP
ncbi:uroporphyrinogen-III C-methyltransferase [Thalassiella azotivora]